VNTLLQKSHNRTQFLRWIGTIGAVVLLIILFKNQGWTEIYSAFQQVSFERFLLGLVLIIISRFAVVGRWHSLLKSVENVPLRQSFRLTFAGLFASNFLPTTIGGDVVRFAGAMQLKVDVVVLAASLIVDRLIGMIGMGIALPFGVIPLGAWLSFSSISPAEAYLGLSLTWVSRFRQRVVNLLHRVYEAVRLWSKHPMSLLSSFVFTLVHMLCLFGTISLLLDDMGEKLPFGWVAGMWSFVYFVTLMPISINGYGVQEISMAFIFTEVGGISLQSGLAVSVLFRTLMMLASVPGAVFIPGILAATKIERVKKESSNSIIGT